MTPEQLDQISAVYNLTNRLSPIEAFDHFCVGILAARENPEFAALVVQAMVAEAEAYGDKSAQAEAEAEVRATIEDLLNFIKPTPVGQN